jgi:hypothetical protein
VIASAQPCTPVPPPNLHGKEGVDGSSPSEGASRGQPWSARIAVREPDGRPLQAQPHSLVLEASRTEVDTGLMDQSAFVASHVVLALVSTLSGVALPGMQRHGVRRQGISRSAGGLRATFGARKSRS